jgi:DNA-binding XRE family transcriptional regulator
LDGGGIKIFSKIAWFLLLCLEMVIIFVQGRTAFFMFDVIIAVRKQQKVTQKRMSKETGISRDRYMRMEKGESPFTEDEFRSILRVLGLRVEVKPDVEEAIEVRLYVDGGIVKAKVEKVVKQ